MNREQIDLGKTQENFCMKRKDIGPEHPTNYMAPAKQC